MAPMPDPFAALHDEGNGVPALRAGFAALRQGDAAGALEHTGVARALGIPTEAAPHAAVLFGLAAAGTGDHVMAMGALRDAWRDHPDFTALPAALGIVLRLAGEHEAGARTLHAALLTEDPDGSLAAWRPLLARGL